MLAFYTQFHLSVLPAKTNGEGESCTCVFAIVTYLKCYLFGLYGLFGDFFYSDNS